MKALLALGAVSALTLLATACRENPAVTTPLADRPSGLPTATVTWIHDGDTVVIEKDGAETTVRLIGVNAPEREECFYQESTDYLIETLKGATVDIEDLGTDQFGRTLVYLWTDRGLVNLDLVAGGWAIATTPNEADSYGNEMLQAERQALDDSAGLWAADACGPAEEVPEISISVEPDPPGPDDKRLKEESVGLANTGAAPVDISGWALRDESSVNRYRFGPGTVIEPGYSIEVSSADPGWEPGDRPVWNNDGDTAILLTAQGTVVARLRYPD